MKCTWLETHAECVIDALWGEVPEQHPLWAHLHACAECASTFQDLMDTVDTLQRLPWADPPRIVYIHPATVRQSRQWERWLTGAMVLLGMVLGIVVFHGWQRTYTREQIAVAVQQAIAAQQTQIEQTCAAMVQQSLRRIEAQWQAEHQQIYELLQHRFMDYDTQLVNLQNRLERVHRRQQYFWQQTQEKLNSLLQASYQNQ